MPLTVLTSLPDALAALESPVIFVQQQLLDVSSIYACLEYSSSRMTATWCLYLYVPLLDHSPFQKADLLHTSRSSSLDSKIFALLLDFGLMARVLLHA